MTRIRGLSDRDLDRRLARAEEAFARAVRAAFHAATERLVAANRALTAAPLPVGGMGVDDVIVAQQVWAQHVPELQTHIAGAFGASADSVASVVYASAGVPDLPDPAVPGGRALAVAATSVVPAGSGLPLVAKFAIDDRARVHLETAANRLVRVGDGMWQDIRSQLVEGFAAGEGIDQIRDRMRGMSDISQQRARTIARTEVISASNAGAMAGARAFPELEPETKSWLATSDARTRPAHVAANGQTVLLDEPFQVGAAMLDYPGAPGPAAEVINCRCTVTFGDMADAPPPLQAEAPATGAGTEGRRQRFAAEHGVSVAQLRASILDVHRLRRRVRGEAAQIQAESLAWLDRADALRIRRPPLTGRGGEYDWAERLHRREHERLLDKWYSTNPIDAPDIVMTRARASGLFTGETVDEFMDEWLFHTRRVDAAGAVRQGRLPNPRRVSGMGVNDVTTSLADEGLDATRVIAVEVEDAAGYLASVQADEVVDQAQSLLGASLRADDPPWRMSFQAWEREVRALEASIAEATSAGRTAVEAQVRYRQLVPDSIDTGQDYEPLYAEIIEVARLADVDVADWAKVPWTE